MIDSSDTSIATPAFTTVNNSFRLFRSSIDQKLFAVHLVDSDENSLMVCTDGLTFDQAQDALEDYLGLSFVKTEESVETADEFAV